LSGGRWLALSSLAFLTLRRLAKTIKEFGFVSALRLNLVQVYVWAILSPLVFRFSRRFPIELRPLNVRNLLLYFPALISFARIHQIIHLAVLWSITPRWRQKYPA
jgi:hypothetical protein